MAPASAVLSAFRPARFTPACISSTLLNSLAPGGFSWYGVFVLLRNRNNQVGGFAKDAFDRWMSSQKTS
jgi:hypothetical protein